MTLWKSLRGMEGKSIPLPRPSPSFCMLCRPSGDARVHANSVLVSPIVFPPVRRRQLRARGVSTPRVLAPLPVSQGGGWGRVTFESSVCARTERPALLTHSTLCQTKRKAVRDGHCP